MKWSRRYAYLVSSADSETGKHTVSVAEKLKPIIRDWQPCTRVSPIFGLVEHGTGGIRTEDFGGRTSLVFAGPVSPQVLLPFCEGLRVWLTLGLFNILIQGSPSTTNSLRHRLRRMQIRHESWSIHDGVVRKATPWAADDTRGTLATSIARLSAVRNPPVLEIALAEYCPLMASASARAAALPDGAAADISMTHGFVADNVEAAQGDADDLRLYTILGQLTTVNAGLSRLSSQLFAGSSPIRMTECHLWSHSLLGIGVPHLALRSIRSFVLRTLGDARIPHRFRQLDRLSGADAPDLSRANSKSDLWHRDYLKDSPLPETLQPLVPLLTYFSGRDGFKASLNTISAPLASLQGANSKPWSLLTLTHEISHVLVRGAMTRLYPDLTSSQDIERSLQLLERGRGDTLLQEIQRYLLLSIFKIDDVHAHRAETPDYTDEQFVHLLRRWQHEVEEVIVHVFDFLYFYGRNTTRYVQGIWSSWGIIPCINDRIREYVVRTVCACLSIHLKSGAEAPALARDVVRAALVALPDATKDGSYVSQAISHLDDHWDDEILPRLLARTPLVKIARAFLFSASLATTIRTEPALKSHERKRGGYKLRPFHVGNETVHNPLRFLEEYTAGARPSLVESAWLFYVLAFDMDDGSGS